MLLRPQLADVYGSVFCIRLGRHKTVFVSGWKMVKEAIVTQADSFVDRPYSPMVTRIYSGNSGGSPKHTARHVELLIPPASDRLSISQLVFSSATATFGGGSAALPWPPYALLAWPKAPWSRASVKKAVTCRRPWRGREVGEDARARKHTPVWLTFFVQGSRLTPCPC